MFFLPVRKISKILFFHAATKKDRTPHSLHECLDKAPDSRQRYFRKWSWLILVILAFCYIAFCRMHSKENLMTKNVTFPFANQTKDYVTKRTGPKINIARGIVADILKHIDEKLKEKEKTSTTKDRKMLVSHERGNKIRNIKSKRSYRNDETPLEKSNDSKLVNATNLPICRRGAAKNETDEQKKMKRLKHNLFPDVKMGGYYAPKNCRSRDKVAILVPYRNRERDLAVFMYYMHPFLIKQQLEYRIFVIEQAGEEPFNRGKLLNVGFKEMQKYGKWNCVVLHDVDLLPQSDKILYSCPPLPLHLVGRVLQSNLTYSQFKSLFGGVSTLSVEHYKLTNGFSNMYWGWGGEDNDMYWRVLSTKLQMVRYSKRFARYKSLPHTVEPRNNYRSELLKNAVARYKSDGLSSLVYEVVWTKYRHLYTHILVDVNPLKEKIKIVDNKIFL